MKLFGRGPRALFVGGSLAAAMLACQAQEKQNGNITTIPPVTTMAPTSTVQRGGFGQTFFQEAAAGSIFVSLFASLFWWSAQPVKGKRRAGS